MSFSVIAIIFASPALIAVTLPSSSTVAIDVSKLTQDIFLYVASVGVIIAVRVSSCPIIKLSSVLFTLNDSIFRICHIFIKLFWS